jgi:hypothetical protein
MKTGVTPAIIGVIEGIAESLASIVKLFSGLVADKYGNKKRLAFLTRGNVNDVYLGNNADCCR